MTQPSNGGAGQTLNDDVLADDYTPKDRTGYTLEVHNADDDEKQTYTVVSREADGVGIGAYHDDRSIDDAIAADRAYLATVKSDTETPDAAAQALAVGDEQTVTSGDVGRVPVERPRRERAITDSPQA